MSEQDLLIAFIGLLLCLPCSALAYWIFIKDHKTPFMRYFDRYEQQQKWSYKPKKDEKKVNGFLAITCMFIDHFVVGAIVCLGTFGTVCFGFMLVAGLLKNILGS